MGRGLRLPVNEYGNRVKEEQFYLNYFVDFTESDFVEKLVNEINEKSVAIIIVNIQENLSDELILLFTVKYNISDGNTLLQTLTVYQKVIDFSRKFINEGFQYIEANYPLIFVSVDSSKIRKATEEKKNLEVRTAKYDELKELWEKLN
ncbi:MAG: hypothetical protein QXO70_02645 [Candidatus Pacearchaeota archaeon]